MTKSHVRRTETGYKANVGGATQPGMGTPNSHSDASMVDPADGGEEGKPYLRRSRFRSAHRGLPSEQSTGIGDEKSAEAIVAVGATRPLRRAESSIAGSSLEDPRTDSAGNSATSYRVSYRVAWATAQWRGGTDLLCEWRPLPPTVSNRERALAAYAAEPIEETAVYDKYVRWCGRKGPRGPSYPILLRATNTKGQARRPVLLRYL
jgi:hypothetical protein